ncbi:MAG: hypothetical protein ABIP36_06985 [Acidimicrobiales bacterium]
MPTYMPVLKGKPGEFAAWRHATASVIANSRPVIEVVPMRGQERDLADILNHVRAGWPSGSVLTLDCGALDQTVPVGSSPDCAVLWSAAALLAEGVAMRPVVRIDDAPPVWAEVGAAHAVHGHGVALRLGSEENDPDPTAAAAVLPALLTAVGVGTDQVDLIIDLWAVESPRDVTRASTVAGIVLAWAHTTGPWRTVTILSGAFPASISNLPTGAATAIPRYDAELYDQVVAAGPAMEVDFGDFVVAHPSMPGAGRGPLPNLRYTAGRDWRIFREPKALPGNQSFFTVCAKVVASPAWVGTSYSWGDAEVDRSASSIGGAGTATQWRSYGTSHHAAVVIDRLATLGAP